MSVMPDAGKAPITITITSGGAALVMMPPPDCSFPKTPVPRATAAAAEDQASSGLEHVRLRS
jgi:hypothetical protein